MKLNRSETIRTILLLVFIAIAIGFIIWVRHANTSDFTNTLR